MLDKQIVRKEMRQKRKLISPGMSHDFGIKLLDNIIPLINDKQNIAIYHADGGEISLQPLVEYLLLNKKNAYRPIAKRSSRILFFEQIYSVENLPIFVPEDYKISNEIECYNLDLIFLPLIAVDKLGSRLGQGGGYYDSTLSNALKPLLCGVGYDWQMLDKLPTEEHDVKLDFFASDSGIIKF